MRPAGALCDREGEALRRALSVAFADDALAARCTAAAFARADRRWRAVVTLPDPMAWVDGVAVRRARRAIAKADRQWSAPEPTGGVLLDRLGPVARIAVVLHALRDRSLDDIADALGTSRRDVATMLRASYNELGVLDPDVDDDTVPYAI
jgi:hypothetical protein